MKILQYSRRVAGRDGDMGVPVMKMVRMQFEVPADKALEIEALMSDCGFTKKSDFFNNAISLLKWVARQTKGGNRVAAVDEKGRRYTELSMPFIDHIIETKTNSRELHYNSA